MVAELTFGFWITLLDRRYERVLWPRLLRSAFPHMPAAIRQRQTLSKRFDDIRKLRNRVFHHEPILNRPNLIQEHAAIIDAIGWISPAMKEMTKAIDRFPAVHTKAHFEQIKAIVGENPAPQTTAAGSAHQKSK